MRVWVGLLLMPLLRTVSYRERDVLPRVVRLRDGRGASLVQRTFGEAKAPRTEWCPHPEHVHAYASWREARASYCRPDNPH